MNNILKYLYQIMIIYIGLLIPYTIYYFFLIYVLKEQLDKGWDFSVVMSISMFLNFIMLLLVFISFNIITSNQKFKKYKFNYLFILINCVLAGITFLFFGGISDKFASQFHNAWGPPIIQFITSLVEYYIICFILMGILKWYNSIKKNSNVRK